MISNRELGIRGEGLASEYLESIGYSIIQRNYRTEYGEIDLIICNDKFGNQPLEEVPLIVFVEVKTRTSTKFGFPETSITETKKEHIISSVDAFLVDHPAFTGDIRIDVISIQLLGSGETPEIVHFENAIS